MGKKLKILKNKESQENQKKSIDFSELLEKSELKVSQTNLENINLDPIKWIKPEKTSSSKDLENNYNKYYIEYMREQFNFKIIKMFFNFIFTSKCIPIKAKDNRHFIKNFLKIIKNLLMNEIELATMAYILEEKMKWVQNQETDEIWYHIYYICLKSKELTSNDDIFNLLMDILDFNNKGFKNNYNEWNENEYSKKCNDKDISIIQINQMYKALMISNDLNQNQGKFINYNEVVDKIMEYSEKTTKYKNEKKVKNDKEKIEKNKPNNNNSYNNNNNININPGNVLSPFFPPQSIHPNLDPFSNENSYFNPSNTRMIFNDNNNQLNISRSPSNINYNSNNNNSSMNLMPQNSSHSIFGMFFHDQMSQ